MNIEGEINISLITDAKQVAQVRIESSRPVHASRVFHDKTLDSVQKMLPMLFSICGTAQACAGARACEQAMGAQINAQRESVRDLLVNMETIREHLWQIMLNWSDFLGEIPEKKELAKIVALQKAYREALTGGHDPFIRGEHFDPKDVNPDALAKARKEINTQLQRLVFNRPPLNWLETNSLEELNAWAALENSVAARLIHHVIQQNWQSVGRCEIDPLPTLEVIQLHDMMQNKQFVSQPQWKNNCYETSCYTRVTSPLMQQLQSMYGNGLLSRLVARLTETAQLSTRYAANSNFGKVAARNDIIAKHHNPGIGQAAAARGQLLHRVQLDNQKVILYQIVAPTEWNFHPQSVVATSLATLAGDTAKIKQQARLIISAIDPCVAYQLSVN